MIIWPKRWEKVYNPVLPGPLQARYSGWFRLPHPIWSALLTFLRCSGFMRGSEDSSEPAFLLVENYNYDCCCWSSDRQRIFVTLSSFFHWFLWLCHEVEEEMSHNHSVKIHWCEIPIWKIHDWIRWNSSLLDEVLEAWDGVRTVELGCLDGLKLSCLVIVHSLYGSPTRRYQPISNKCILQSSSCSFFINTQSSAAVLVCCFPRDVFVRWAMLCDARLQNAKILQAVSTRKFWNGCASPVLGRPSSSSRFEQQKFPVFGGGRNGGI